AHPRSSPLRFAAMSCPCGRPAELEACCGPLLAGAPAPTAEALMRSRYTAYVTGAIDYIIDSQAADKGVEVDREATEQWSKEAEWLGLEIVTTEGGGPKDEIGTVEFVARWKAKGQELKHHERSRFKKVEGRWFYVDGDQVKPPPAVRVVTPGRNDPCSCGSGKKYKKCHGA